MGHVHKHALSCDRIAIKNKRLITVYILHHQILPYAAEAIVSFKHGIVSETVLTILFLEETFTIEIFFSFYSLNVTFFKYLRFLLTKKDQLQLKLKSIFKSVFLSTEYKTILIYN